MGLFKKIKKKVKKLAKPVKRITAAVATGGLTEVARAAGAKDLAKGVSDLFVPTNLQQLAKTASIVAAPVLGVTAGASALTAKTAVLQPAGTTGGQPMALGNVLGGLQGVLGTVGQFGGAAGTVAQIGSGFLSGFLPAQGPKMGTTTMQPQMTMAAAPIIAGAGAAVASFVAPILARMSVSLGKNITLRAAMIIIRRLGKTLQSPAAVAAAVGLSLSELSQLLTANALAGSTGRRMNPGNVKALRRAHRRIKSFHKLCAENDRLRAPRRRSSQPKVINVRGRACD